MLQLVDARPLVRLELDAVELTHHGHELFEAIASKGLGAAYGHVHADPAGVATTASEAKGPREQQRVPSTAAFAS